MSRYISEPPVKTTVEAYKCGKCSRVCLDERMAIFCCATGSICDDCGGETDQRHYGVCQPCRQLRRTKKFYDLELIEWDGETPLCTWDSDVFFWTEEDVACHLEEHEYEDPSDLHLVTCKPVKMRPVDDDYWCDDLPEDMELEEIVSAEIWAAIRNLNELTKDFTISWLPGNQRVETTQIVEQR